MTGNLRPAMARTRCSAVLAGLVALQMGGVPATAEEGLSVLEGPAPRHGAIETGDLLRPGALELRFGSHQTAPGTAVGTGRQVYTGGMTWRGDADLQFGLAAQVHDDPPEAPVGGLSPNITLLGLAGDVKWPILSTGRLSFAAAASLEAMRLDTELFGTPASGGAGDRVIGSLSFPLTYLLTPTLRAHLAPSLAVLPDALNGRDFFGASARLGAGATWQPARRLQAYGGALMPLGPGGNTLSETGEIERTPVWTLGARYAVTPRAAVDLFASNGLGATPATRHLTSFGDGSSPLFGAMLSYTPGRLASGRESYRPADGGAPIEGTRAVGDGLTLASGDTLPAGRLSIGSHAGTSGSAGLSLRYSPDRDLEFEALLERYGEDGSVGPDRNPSGDPRYMLGGRLRLLDQALGDPVSLSVRALAGRDVERPTVGVFYLALPMSRRLGEASSLTLSPRLASLGETTILGLGTGMTQALTERLRLLGEMTAVDGGEPAVWAAGLQYDLFPKRKIGLEISAGNAIGTQGLGAMVAQEEPILRLGIEMTLGRGSAW